MSVCVWCYYLGGKEVALEEEVPQWVLSLGTADLIVVDRHIELRRQFGRHLRLPHSRRLGDGLLEVRFT